MSSFAPLFADAEGIIKLVIVLLLFIVPAIGQLIAKIKSIQQPPGGMPRPPQPERPVPADVVNEIEDFLKRAAQKREPKQIVAPQVRQTLRRTERIEQPVKAEIIAEAPVGGKVEEHVKKYLASDEFSIRGNQLGGEVAQADKQIDQRLRQVFDHQVSQLASMPGEAAAPPVANEPLELVEASALAIPDSFATGLIALLTDADSVRQAIVLGEVFRRPEERWA